MIFTIVFAPMPFLSPQSPPPGCVLPTALGDTRVISYTYDPLYRLNQAAYSTGECYQYSYDRVGNRTAMTTTIATITYQYDNANRLINAGGVSYTWDNNGNLLNDGSALYRYDRANRLISTTLGSATSLFNYNGDGVRLKQIIAGTVTTYTQDVAAPLPVVLQSRTGVTTTKYLYSLGSRPLAQNGGAWEYLLPDALGSVRQIVDTNGNVTLAKAYEPYGSVLTSTGTASSIFAYAGEQIDTTGLIYLRARYLNPRLGIFLARDPWEGDVMRPGSMNGYNYGLGNPLKYADPSGLQVQCPINGWDCDAVNNIAALKDAFLDSASRHNRIPTMDNNGFAALIASVIVSERKIGNTDKNVLPWILDKLEGAAARIGCIVSGYAFRQALNEGRIGDAFIRYPINHVNFEGNTPQRATVGIGNVSIDKAADLWMGQACDSSGVCVPARVNRLQTLDGSGQPAALSDPFRPYVRCTSAAGMGFCQEERPSDERIAIRIESQLLDNRTNIEYVAANLEAGALRALSLDPPLQPSAFNSAAWHLKSLQADREIEVSRWQPCPGGACLIVDYIPTALMVLGLTSTWNKSMEPQYAHWKALYP